MIKKEDIKHIADLARLRLSDDEIKEMSEKIPDILGLIERLKEVDVEGIEPTAQVTGSFNVAREDEGVLWDEEEKEQALGQAPERKDNEIKVKRVMK
jgi:aspartyl-tRNA(Asn)/glutamyl-tRNA(Gln) amidotransferase subunit C